MVCSPQPVGILMIESNPRPSMMFETAGPIRLPEVWLNNRQMDNLRNKLNPDLGKKNRIYSAMLKGAF